MTPEVLLAVAVGTLLVAAMIGLGAGIARRAVGETVAAWRLLPAAAAVGFSIVALTSYLLHALGPRPPAAVILAGAVIGAGCGGPFWLRLARELRSDLRQLAPNLTPTRGILAVLAGGYLLLHALEAMTPPRPGDALQGYMFTARWLNAHGLVPSPWNLGYGAMPLHTEMVFALSYPFGTDLAAKVIDGQLAVLFLISIHELASRFLSHRLAFLAASSMALTPGFFKLFGTGKIDIAASFVFLQAIALALPQAGEGESRPLRGSTLWLSSWVLGTALAQKYTLWIFLPSFLALLMWRDRTLGTGSRARRLVLALLVIGVPLLPHFAKNIAWSGNPMAPFARELFSDATPYGPVVKFDDAAPMSGRELLLLPYTVFFDTDRSMWYGWLPPLLLVGLPLYFLFCWRRATTRTSAAPPSRAAAVSWLAPLALLQLLPWILYARESWLVVRFLYVPLVLLVVVAAAGVGIPTARWWRRATDLALILLFAYFGIYLGRYAAPSWRFVLGLENRAAWQTRMAPERAWHALHAVAEELDSGCRLFLVRSPFVVYNLPPEALPFLGTEEEAVLYGQLPESQRLEWLRRRGFGFMLDPGGRGEPPVAGLLLWRSFPRELTVFLVSHSQCDERATRQLTTRSSTDYDPTLASLHDAASHADVFAAWRASMLSLPTLRASSNCSSG